MHHLQFLGDFKHRPSRYCGTSCTDDTVCYEGGKSLQGSRVSLVLDFADDGSSSHECFIMVFVMLRIRCIDYVFSDYVLFQSWEEGEACMEVILLD